MYDAATGKIAGRSEESTKIRKVMMAPDSSGCLVFFDNSAFPSQNQHDDYVVKLSFPGLKVTELLRVLEGLSNASLSPDGKRIMLLQGDQDRLLFFDAANLKPLK